MIDHFAENTFSEPVPIDIVATVWLANQDQLSEILPISGMARTPFHNFFLDKHIKSLEAEVRLFKYWCKQKYIYGQGGFTGFLTELLIIIYGSFEKLLKHAKEITSLCYDFHNRSQKIVRNLFPKEKIIIVDPIDTTRNAAAGIHGLVGDLKITRFLQQATEAFVRPDSLWDKFVIKKPYIRLKINFSEKIIIKNVDEAYSRLGRVLSSLNGNLKTKNIQLQEGVIDPDKNVLQIKVNRIDAQKIEKRGPPISLISNSKEFRSKHSVVWESKDFLWTRVQLP
ncbi:MAG: hypothetical protein ACXAC7_02220, partial [Candidatus Hodarchaeales archaeon]